ncbi:hypothetical protein Hdeb2414_s0003g00096391 [Helianthus debilis subsp. tardiflorus]
MMSLLKKESYGCLSPNVILLAQQRTNIYHSSKKSKMEWFVLENCAEVREYMNEFKHTHPQDDLKTKFPGWFLHKVHSMKTQNSPEFHPELYALSICTKMTAYTYTACIVNGVRFKTLERDAKCATQNSGVEVVGENGVKFYGQLEEIIELHYTNNYSTVLFRCKWFDTRRGVNHDNNITSISTEHEWDKDDQLIFSSQAKQVFFIQETSRNQKNKHRWVVENVNHRRIWDRPLNDDDRINKVQNVDKGLEDNDVVDNNSSSDCPLVIDLTQYFQIGSSHVTVGEPSIEVNPPMATVYEVFEVESDWDEVEADCDEDDPDYVESD